MPKQISWTLDGKWIFEKMKAAADKVFKAKVRVSIQTGGCVSAKKVCKAK